MQEIKIVLSVVESVAFEVGYAEDEFLLCNWSVDVQAGGQEMIQEGECLRWFRN